MRLGSLESPACCRHITHIRRKRTTITLLIGFSLQQRDTLERSAEAVVNQFIPIGEFHDRSNLK